MTEAFAGDRSQSQALSWFVPRVPAAHRFPDEVAARITLDGEVFESPGFRRTICMHAAPVVVGGEIVGAVEVSRVRGDVELPPEAFFLPEEVELLHAMANRLGLRATHMRTAARLRRSEQHYRTLFGSMLEAMGIVELLRDESGAVVDYRVVEVNPSFERHTGVAAARAVGAMGSALFGAPSYLSDLSGASESRQASSFTLHSATLGRTFAAAALPVGEDRIALVLEDVTLQRLAEQAMLDRGELEDRLTKIGASVPGVVCSYRMRPDGSACMPLSTETADDLFGIPRAAIAEDVGPFFANFHPDDLPAVTRSIEQSARDLTAWHAVFRYLHPHKGPRWLEGHSVPQRESDGGTIWHGFVMDVTERKIAEAARLRMEERHRTVIETLEHVVFSFDLGGRVTFVSGSVVRYGYDPHEVVGQSWRRFVHPDDLPAITAYLERVVAGHTEPHEFRVIDRDGKVRFTRVASRVAVEEPHDVGITGVLIDLTQQRDVEEQLRQAQKMEAVGRLAGGVAHDFNNLLTVIGSYTELVLRGYAPDDKRHADLSQIRAATDRAATLVRQLLAFSRKQILQPEVLDLGEVVSGTEKMLRRVIGEDVQLRVAAEPGLWPTRADRGQIEQVLMNLAVNARDAMPDGGRLTITTGNVVCDPCCAAPQCANPGPYVVLSVSDDGCGMDDATRARVFEPFFTTKGPSKGTGLGLATVYGIVTQSGGHVTVASELGKGTTFTVYLPRHDAPGAVPSVPRPVVATGGSETILLVEDEEAVRKVACRILSSAGFVVLAAESGEDALRMFERHAGEVRAVITDVIMPGMSGRELADEILARSPATKVLFMSGYSDDVIARGGVLEAGRSFIQKPFTAAALTRKVRTVLDGLADAAG
ncbi:MAG: PAS domain S-box protein [Deltaproteobacteria bacterium]|nr:PAS domain S-box protein [Deltaproteobacteria bacterium]